MILLVLFLSGIAVEAQQKCGYTPITQSRVIGGQDAVPGAWPWQIALKRSGRFTCGGSLISADWVITAAHCVARSSNPSSYQIVVGEHDRTTTEGTEQTVGVKRIISHPQYNSPRLSNDIALIELSQPVALSPRVNPVCLPTCDKDVATGSTCYITGWGKIQHPGSSHPILQQALLPPIDNQKCKQKIQASGAPINFTSQMLCAGVENTILSGCHGDSGGPYVCLNRDYTYTLHGAVSWGSPRCDTKELFSVFARVTQFLPWIKQHTNIGAGVGAPTPPVPTTPGNTGWTDYSPMWCTLSNRSPSLGLASSSEQCKNLCLQNNSQCKAVEWWQGSDGCYECYDPSKRVPYTNTGDSGYPPHVVVKPNQGGTPTPPTPPVPTTPGNIGWTDYSPMWCTLSNRSPSLGLASSSEQCKNLCLQNNPQCKAVEWWQGSDGCYECYDPSKRVPYTNTGDSGYPPHVVVKPNQGGTPTPPTPTVPTTPGNIGGSPTTSTCTPPTPPVPTTPGNTGWTDYSPMWCTLSNRSPSLGLASSSEQCKNLCLQNNPQCKAVEWWEGSDGCYECYDPSKRVPYTNTGDSGYPPHVIVKPNSRLLYSNDPPKDGSEVLKNSRTQEQLSDAQDEESNDRQEDPPIDGSEGLEDSRAEKQLSDTQDKQTMNGIEVTTHARKRRDVSQPIKDGVPVSLSREKQQKKHDGTAFIAMKKLREKRGVFARLMKKAANTE